MRIVNGEQLDDGVDEPEIPWEDDEWPDQEPPCEACGNLGTLNCYCGGDICVCSNNGEYECPGCSY